MEIEILSHHTIWYILLTAIGVAAGIFSYRSSFPPLEKFWKIVLAVLRAAMIILIGIFLIEPLINLYSSRTITPQLAVLFDTSKSMGIKENAGSRLSQADDMMRKAFSGLKSNYGTFVFSTDLAPSDGLPSESKIAGDATSIANALQDLGNRKDFDKYGAIALVTDGRQNLGEDPLRIASKLNIPIYTFTVGEKTADKNLAVENVIYPAVAYSGDTLKIDAEISASGLAEDKSRAFLKLGPKTVAEKPFDIPQENRKVKVSTNLVAPEPGNYEYTLSAPVLPDESNKADNERVFAIRVLKNKIKVFLGSDKLDWEYKFINQSLRKYPEIGIDAVYPQAPGNFADPGTPRGVDGLKKYDVIILVDSAPSKVRIQNSDLKKYLDDGGSLIHIAGDDAITDLRFFEDILPIKLDNPRLVTGEFLFEPSPTEKQHAAILLHDDPDESVRLWRSLPPFEDVITGVTPTGQVLIEANLNTREKDEKGNLPVLTVGTYGKGHVAAITGYAWWRSYFGSVNDPRIASAIPEFWRNLSKWASSTEQMQNFKIITDRKVYRLGEPVRLTGYLYDQANRPRGGAYVSVSLSLKGENTALKDVVLPPVDNGIYSEETSSLAPGKYEFNGIATSSGDTLGKATGEFTIENFSLEMTSSSPDYGLTRRLAEATGGVAYDKDNAGNFPSQLKLAPYAKENQASIKPFGMPVLLGILLLGLCIEWGLRKKFRLP